MIEIQRILADQATVISGLQKRKVKDLEKIIQTIIQLHETRKDEQQERERLQAQVKIISKNIQGFMKSKNSEAAAQARHEVGELKAKLKVLDLSLRKHVAELDLLLIGLPNVPHPTVPVGQNEADNELVEKHEHPISKVGKHLPHWELIKKYDIIDFELGSKVSGAGFPIYKNKGARLQRGLINFFLDEAVRAGYSEIQPPILVNERSAFGTGQLPDKEKQMYHIEGDDLYCIPTAEVPLTNIYRDRILRAEDLPLKLAGYTPCFRREAGSWGANVRGLNRLHQFDKVEIIQITHPEKSYLQFEAMLAHVRMLLNKLGLTYRIVRLCGGDLGFAAALTFDFEVYAAGQGKWLEVSSVSNFETFQANRLKLRMKEAKRSKLLHTLNGSALALPRVIAALLENNQAEDHIPLPEVLHSYCGFKRLD